MDQVTNPLNNDVRLEMDIPNHQVVAYQDNYKLLGVCAAGDTFWHNA